MTNYKFIVNPTSSRGKGIKVGQWLEAECLSHKMDFDLQYTEQPLDAKDIAKKSVGKFEYIVAVGGDGTLQEVINGCYGNKTKIAIIPVGTGNDFVRAIHLPAQPQTALNVLQAGYTKTIDVGKIDDRIFHNAVGIGFDAWVVKESLNITKLRGHLVYLYSILKTLRSYKTPVMQLQYNNQELNLNALLITIGNGNSLGGGIKLTPYAKIDDGLLDLTIIEDVNKFKLLLNLFKTYLWEHVTMPEVTMDTCKSVRVKSETGLAVHADGELVSCDLKEINIKILPKAIEFVVPESTY